MLNHEAKKKRKNPNFQYSIKSVLLEKTRSTMKYSFTPIRMAIIQKSGEIGPLCMAGGNIKWCSWCAKVWHLLQHRVTLRSGNTTSQIYPGELKAGPRQVFYTNVHSSIIPSSQKVETTNQNVHQQMKGETKCGTYITQL